MAVCFCGTILTITRTGSYPASPIFRESGLSSDLAIDRQSATISPTLSSSSLIFFAQLIFWRLYINHIKIKASIRLGLFQDWFEQQFI